MKIDIHVHTKKCKQGDAETREISSDRFCEIVLSTSVKILAITNHNFFDLTQFEEIQKLLKDDAQVWPGVELDIVDDGNRGHMLVIVSPSNAQEFSSALNKLTKGSNPDTFSTTIENVVQFFDKYGPLYIAHYKQKKPNISDSAIDDLIASTDNPCRVIKEVTNSISAGIYISHGHSSIYGSDVQNWDKYAKLSHALPDLRLPVESFDHFCLLLEKDSTTINTLLDKKTSEDLKLIPFEDATAIELRVYNDINVVFGSKGTGKSCILKAISRHYSEKGIDAKVFTSTSDLLDKIYDRKGRDITLNLEHYGINYCTDEIAAIRNASEVDVTSLNNYSTYFQIKGRNKNAKKILLKEIETEEASTKNREFLEYNTSAITIKKFLEFLSGDKTIQKEIEQPEKDEVLKILTQVADRLNRRKHECFSEWKEIELLNSAIETCRHEVARKAGEPSKPSKTGFAAYSKNRIRIEVNAKEILGNIEKEIEYQTIPVGSLGLDKGKLNFETKIKTQDGSLTDGKLSSLTGVAKSTQKSFAKLIYKIADHIYSEDLFEYIAEFEDIDNVDEIKTIHELLQFRRYFSIGEEPYTPSSGEASMLMLQKELEEDKDVYILDEPERSLGNDYINDVIVPILKEKARSGKRIFISTHDANIAVRTLPYSSIYRCHGPGGYDTYTGNPFSNNLINLNDDGDMLDWKKVSMKTLEGGEEAFGERGKIYGSN